MSVYSSIAIWSFVSNRTHRRACEHGGRYYGKAASKTVLTDIRVETLKRYGIETALAPRFPDPVAREAAIREQAANWDANSLIILRRRIVNLADPERLFPARSA
jgi:hypothetical protein